MDEDISAEKKRSRSEERSRSEAGPSKSMKPVEQVRMTPDMVSAIAQKVVSILQSSSSRERALYEWILAAYIVFHLSKNWTILFQQCRI